MRLVQYKGVLPMRQPYKDYTRKNQILIRTLLKVVFTSFLAMSGTESSSFLAGFGKSKSSLFGSFCDAPNPGYLDSLQK